MVEDVRPSGLDELAAALADLLPLGDWVTAAACAGMAEVFSASRKPDTDELSVAERVCRRCPVRQDCADFASQEVVWGVWAGVWHDGKAARHEAA